MDCLTRQNRHTRNQSTTPDDTSSSSTKKNGATLVEANGTETITLARISEGRLEDLSHRLSERLGQTR